ncbi:uncharacterized protein LOC118429410 [Branchiostoma floridae]|uniref:Uncharacterized protein LOC118429410 n=1 Tax=Branchiostoma floridae TaxID=7739 RepID=A0A9J7MAS3_BRAFL|nr:uncharacterized protein LOC118429410 [Branchiostoma floridae]
MDNPAVLLLSEVYGKLKGGISTIYRRLATLLREREPDIRVSSAVLEATEDDKDEAKRDGVELLLPKVDPGDERTEPSLHWLTFDHRVKYPDLPSNTRTIVGHTDGTSRGICRIKQDRCPEATVVLFIDDIPEDTEQYKGDEEAMGIGKKEDSILKDAEQADVVFSIGDRIFGHFKSQFRAIPAKKRPRHIRFLPRPSSIFEKADAEYSDAETMVVLCIGRVAGVEKLKGLDLAVEALSIVAGKMRVKLRVRGVDKDNLQVTSAILEHCKSADLQITFFPYGTQKDICKDMLQSHLVLMPSRAEPFGLVGLEAIATGVPVLVSDKSGLADLINKFAPRYHNCIVETDAGGDDQRNVGNWARCIERVLRHCEAEFETAANLKRELLSTKYWEESERLFINVCTTEGGSSPRLSDSNSGTQRNEGPIGSSSDEESLQENYRILRVSEKIFDEEVLNSPEELESRLLDFRQHVDDALHYFKLSCKAKLRIKRSVKHHAAKVHRVLFPEIKLRSRYGKLVKCFNLYCATLKKIEDGCVLCTLEFDGSRDLVTFLRGYRDGKLSETLTQELITEEMQEKEGPGVYVHVTLLVASDTTRTGDKGSKPEETDRTQGDEEMKTDDATGASDTPGLKKSISLDDLHAMQMQISPAQNVIFQLGLINLDLATTSVQESRLKDWACDSLTNQLAQRLAMKSRHVRELQSKVRSTIELHNNRVEEQADVIHRLRAEFRNLTQKIESAEKVLSDKNTEIQQQKEANKNSAVVIEDLQAENAKLLAKLAAKKAIEDMATSTDVPRGGESDEPMYDKTRLEKQTQTDPEVPSEQRPTSPEQTSQDMEASEEARAADTSRGLLQTGAEVPPDSDPRPTDVVKRQGATSRTLHTEHEIEGTLETVGAMSRELQENPTGQAQVLITSADDRVEIKTDDLGPEEQEIFRRFAEKAKNVTDQSPVELLQTLHEEVGQHVDEEAWMGQAYVRIGIVGVSGAGKSTYINSFRGLRASDPGAAAVGVIETTTEAEEYRHPKHDHVILVDFPGALFKLEGGHRRSVTFDMKEYTRKFEGKMKECNVLLVFTSVRVHDNAVWIAAKAREIGKKVLFVRSMLDVDIYNKQRDDPAYFTGGQEEGEKRLLQLHRQDYVTMLETMGYGRVAPEEVFIISGMLEHIQRGSWDAPALKEAMLKQLHIQQQILFITICQDFSPTMARAKAKIYKSRAWKVALRVAAAGVIPFAGGSINAGIFITTVTQFKRGFGLDETSVRKLAVLTGKEAADLQHFVDERMSLVNKITQYFQGDIDIQSLKEALVAAGASEFLAGALAVDAAIDMAVPFIGGLFTAPASYRIASNILNLVIEQQEKCALALYELAFR